MKGKIIFFGTMFVFLFVGDGKKSIIDVVAAAGILALGIIVVTAKNMRFPSGKIVFWWMALLVYLLLRLPFSDSVAYSLYATLRFVYAFIVFIVSFNSEITPRFFSRAVVGFTLVGVALSALFLFVPSMRSWMPEMSLLSNAYGHHHIAYLLVFSLPFVVRGLVQTKSWLYGSIFTLYIVSLVLTRARGGWFIVSAYLLYVLLRGKLVLRKRFRFTGVFFAIVLFIIFLATSFQPDLFRSPALGALRARKSDFILARGQYWQQGIQAIAAHPLFGTGLGTFYLSSLQYQQAPNSYSWFAHSFPIQMAVETGFIGVCVMIGLFWSVGRRIKLHDGTHPIVEAVVLSGLYSMYEINFDYLIIWLLVWASLGLLLEKEKNIYAPKTLLYVPIGCIAFLYVIFIAAEAAQMVTNNRVFLQPYNTQRTLAYLKVQKEATSLSQKQLDTILWFHRKNPEVLAAAGVYEKAVTLDPQRVEYMVKYINVLLEQNDRDSIARILNLDMHMSPLLTKELFVNVGSPASMNEYYAKLYYFVGLSVLNTHPEQTRELWIKARDSAPGWGYFHAELASLEYFVFKETTSALKILSSCIIFPNAADQCKSTTIETLLLPGRFKEYVKTIPTVDN